LDHHNQMKLNQSRSPVTSPLLSFFCQSSWILPRSWGLVFFSKFPLPATFLGTCTFFKVPVTCHVPRDLFFQSNHNLPRFKQLFQS
jgi:hypothetical protein